jgi:hypothetical protein
MNYIKLEQFVSKPRLERYLHCCSNSQPRALELYKANLNVSQAFYPILNLMETFLRNSINNQLSQHYSDIDWIINQKNGFMNDNSLGPKFWLKSQIDKAEIRTKGQITSGKIIAEQTLGFWTSLFEPSHYKLISGYVINCFPNKPRQINRNNILKNLNEIREFRNRIYHNESICFNKMNIDFAQAMKTKKLIYEILEWMDTDLINYIMQFDRIDNEIQLAMAL